MTLQIMTLKVAAIFLVLTWFPTVWYLTAEAGGIFILTGPRIYGISILIIRYQYQ